MKKLEQRIEEIRAEVDELINRRVEELRIQTEYNLPPTVLRHGIEAKAFGCQCRQYLAMVETK